MKLRAAAALAALLLAACGQKSALYLPDDAPTEVSLTPEGIAAAAAAAAAKAAPAGTVAPAEPVTGTETRDDEDTRPRN